MSISHLLIQMKNVFIARNAIESIYMPLHDTHCCIVVSIYDSHALPASHMRRNISFALKSLIIDSSF